MTATEIDDAIAEDFERAAEYGSALTEVHRQVKSKSVVVFYSVAKTDTRGRDWDAIRIAKYWLKSNGECSGRWSELNRDEWDALLRAVKA